MSSKIFKAIKILFLTAVITLSIPHATPTTHAQDRALADTLMGSGKCVVANASTIGCKTMPTGGDNKVLRDLYNAIYSQGAVITLLDEPLSNENLITVVKVCGYIQNPNNANQITLGRCYEYYSKTCPKSTDDKITQTVKTSKGEDTTNVDKFGYFRCQLKQVIIASSGAGLAQKYLKMIYDFGTTLAGIIAVLIIMINGIKIIVSGSDEAAVSDAKKQITTSLIALAVLFMSGFILYIINPNFFTA